MFDDQLIAMYFDMAEVCCNDCNKKRKYGFSEWLVRKWDFRA